MRRSSTVFYQHLLPAPHSLRGKLPGINMIVFKFDSSLLTGGQSPAIICTVCGLEGHLQNICPDEQIPLLTPLPFPLSGNHQLLLDRVCEEVMHDWQPKNVELLQREGIVNSCYFQ